MYSGASLQVRISSILVFILSLSVVSTRAANYYVNDGTYDGDDIYTTAAGSVTGAGTSGDPYERLQQAFDNNDLGAGDTVFIDAGTFNHTIISVGSNDEAVVIKGVDSTKTTLTNTAGDRVLYLNGVDDLVFSHIEFKKNTTNHFVVDIPSTSEDNVFTYCSFTQPSGSHGAVFNAGDHNTFSYCTFWSTYDGIMEDWGSTPSGNVYHHNIFDMDHVTTWACISLRGPNDTIHSNEFNGGQYGLFIDMNAAGAEVYNNYFFESDFAVYVNGTNANFDFYYNSCESAKNCVRGNLSGWDIRNNILYTTDNTGSYYCIYTVPGNPTTLDYNLYYHPNAGQAANFNTSGVQATLSDIQSNTGFETNGVEGDPQFTDAANGDMSIPNTSPAIGAGVAITGFTTDIRSFVRDASNPVIGGFEVDGGFPLPVEMGAAKVICGSSRRTIHWTTHTEVNNAHFTLLRSEDGQRFEPVGQVNGMGTTAESQRYAFEEYLLQDKAVYYQIEQTDFDGKTNVEVELFSGACASLKTKPSVQVQVQENSLLATIDVEQPQQHLIYVVDINGAIVRQVQPYLSTGIQQLNVSLPTLAAGTYTMVVKSAGMVAHQKFIHW